MKPIVFLTTGTRGDVQPILALARGLQSQGHVVRFAAPPAFRELVETQSIPFTPLEGNPSDLLTAPGTQSALTFNDNPLRGLEHALGYLKAARPVYKEMIENGWMVSQDASALAIGLPTIWGSSIAEALGIPCIGAFLQPVTRTSEFPSPLLPSQLDLGRVYNRLTYWLISQAVYLPWRGVINQWRKNSLGLSPLPLAHNMFAQMDAILFGFSEKVVASPRDWNSNNHITGYWSLDMPPFTPMPELQKFIEAGEKPLYIGFGSPGMHKPGALIDLLFNAIQETNIRALISIPRNMETNPVRPRGFGDRIYLLREDIPYRWLFPQMAGIIHHGGAGTTGEALKAGVPSLILPLAVDQFFWGERVFQLGVSPRAIPHRQLTVENLVKALEEMKAGKLKESARKLGGVLKAEDGIGNAVRAMETILKTEAG